MRTIGSCSISELDHVDQRSPTFLAPGTGFVEDSFSTEGDGWWFQDGSSHYIYCALYYYYIVMYNEIIIQLTIMQTQWEP